MENQDDLNNYIAKMNKIIKSGDPKYLSFVSREYMKYKKQNPVVADTLEGIMFNVANRNDSSPYEVFFHGDGGICMEAIDDISRISNVGEFVDNINKLSSHDIDFSKLSADDLIAEADTILAEIEAELNQQISEIESAEIDDGEIVNEPTIDIESNDKIQKLGFFNSLSAAISALINRIVSRANNAKSRRQEEARTQQEIKKQAKEDELKSSNEENSKSSFERSFDEVCPKVVVSSLDAIKKQQELDTSKKVENDTYGDGDPDGNDVLDI